MAEKRKRRQSDIDATRRYDAKTYKKFNIAFRIDDDAGIIRALNEAHARGIAGREVIKAWYEASKKQPI